MGTKEYEVVKIKVEEGIDLQSEIKCSLLLNMMLLGGNSFIIQCCVSGRHH